MSEQSAGIKAFEEKVSAQLQEAKAKIDEIEAHAKGKVAQAEIDAINSLKAKRQEIEKKRHELKTAGDTKVEHLKSEIETEMARYKTSLSELATKLKS